MTFVDTSALLALLNVVDDDHARVSNALRRVDSAITHNYVVVETEALTRRRLGATASRRFLDLVADIAEIRWVDRDLHDLAIARLEPPGRRASLVDEVSFAFMREQEIGTPWRSITTSSRRASTCSRDRGWRDPRLLGFDW